MTPRLIIDNVRNDLAEERAKASPAAAVSGGGNGGQMNGAMDERVRRVEQDVAGLKGSVDWAKIAVSVVAASMFAGFSLITALLFNVTTKIDGVSAKLADEFRMQRQEQAAQIAAISGAITATKQQVPQVIMVPAPESKPKP